MATNYTDITLALAGICQAAKLVQQFALQGSADEQAFNTSLNSLLEMSPESTIAVYGDDINNLKLGLETLIEQLNANNPELTSYWLGLIALAGRLKKNPQAKAELARRVQYMPTQLEYYGLTDDIMLEKIADIYSDVVSPMGKRIQILGSIEYLQQPAIQNRVRACLLAGMRSAILWQQVGGTKWQLLFSRGKILATAKQIYDTL